MMKTKVSTHFAPVSGLLAGVLMTTAVPAVELPAPAAPPEPAIEDAGEEARVEPMQAEVMPADDADPIAYLGVGGVDVPELLSIHLGLQQGEGVVVRTLDPNGPAAAAGVVENDIVLRVGDRAVGSQAELREAIIANDPGNEVKIDLVHEGEPMTKAVELVERPADAAPPGLGQVEDQARRLREAIQQQMELGGGWQLEGLQGPRVEGLQQLPGGQFPDAARQMKFMFRGGGLQGGQFFQHGASVRMDDEAGSIEMQEQDGSRQIRVRDKAGKLEWEGPWDTEQDKAAAPEEIRERIERLSIDMVEQPEHGGLRLQIQPHGLDIEPDR